jgi:hypothetical protein
MAKKEVVTGILGVGESHDPLAPTGLHAEVDRRGLDQSWIIDYANTWFARSNGIGQRNGPVAGTPIHHQDLERHFAGTFKFQYRSQARGDVALFIAAGNNNRDEFHREVGGRSAGYFVGLINSNVTCHAIS